MKKYLYCVLDKVSKEVSAPIVLNNDDVARRFYRSEVMEKSPYPADYGLLCVGLLDCSNGEIYTGGYPFEVKVDEIQKELFDVEEEK